MADYRPGEFEAADSEGNRIYARKVNAHGHTHYVDVETSARGVFLNEAQRRAFAAFLLDGLPGGSRG